MLNEIWAFYAPISSMSNLSRGLQIKRGYIVIVLKKIFLNKTYGVNTQKDHLNETVLLNTPKHIVLNFTLKMFPYLDVDVCVTCLLLIHISVLCSLVWPLQETGAYISSGGCVTSKF